MDSPWEFCRATVTATVHQTAESAEEVAYGNAGSQDVAKPPEIHVFAPSEEHDAGNRANQAAIIYKAAVADHEGFPPGLAREVLFPVGNDVKGASAGDGTDQEPGDDVVDGVWVDACAGSAFSGQPETREKTDGEQNSVPRHVEAA